MNPDSDERIWSMYTRAALLDMLDRTHVSLAKLIDHCRTLTDEELHRKLEGFGIPTIQLQLHHEIGAQRYWFGVLEGRMDVDDDEGDHPTADDLEDFRRSMQALTRRYLESTSDEALNTPRRFTTWGGHEAELRPAHVVIRTLTHYYQHQGQIAAMCRLMGKPIPTGLDFPLKSE